MSDPFTVLALDVSTKVGFAYGPRFGDPKHGVWLLPKAPAGIGERMSALYNKLHDALQVMRPALVIFEAPIAKVQTSARLLIGLAASVEQVCWEASVRCLEEHADKARGLVLGRSRFSTVNNKGKRVSANKPAVIAWCEQQGWTPEDDNSADALLLWRYAHTVNASRAMA
jgi:hypothetical protein